MAKLKMRSLSMISHHKKAIAIARELLDVLDVETISQRAGVSIAEIQNLN